MASMPAPMTPSWHAPIPNWNPTSVPRAQDNHPGAFGVERRHHFHEGVDLYTFEHAPVFAVENGIVVRVTPFTGAALGHTWWNDTDAVFVHGASGVVVYGELHVESGVREGSVVRRGEVVGRVARVLKVDKGRPMDMLHMELRDPNHKDALELFDWSKDKKRPMWLLDPTPFLLGIT